MIWLILHDFRLCWCFHQQNGVRFFAFVGVFTNKMESDLLVKTPTKAENLLENFEESYL
jgi:hypothetical protein